MNERLDQLQAKNSKLKQNIDHQEIIPNIQTEETSTSP